MKEDIVFGLLSFIFIYLYFKIVAYLWNNFVPFNPITEILSMLVIIIVIIPASLVSSHLIISFIKNN